MYSPYFLFSVNVFSLVCIKVLWKIKATDFNASTILTKLALVSFSEESWAISVKKKLWDLVHITQYAKKMSQNESIDISQIKRFFVFLFPYGFSAEHNKTCLPGASVSRRRISPYNIKHVRWMEIWTGTFCVIWKDVNFLFIDFVFQW